MDKLFKLLKASPTDTHNDMYAGEYTPRTKRTRGSVWRGVTVDGVTKVFETSTKLAAHLGVPRTTVANACCRGGMWRGMRVFNIPEDQRHKYSLYTENNKKE